MNAIADTTAVVASDECLSTTVVGEAVVLHAGRSEYYGFNEVGSLVWELLQEPRTAPELCREVREAYDVDGEQCRRDVDALLGELLEYGLVRRVQP